jgi:magnesium-transporting ATPase (P-type)
MISGPDAQRIKAQLLIWWILWAGVLAGLCLIFVFLTRNKPLPAPSASELRFNLIGFVPLFLSIVIRWLVLPRYTDPQRALVVFICGLALAEGCGLLGIFIGGPYRDALFVLGVLGIAQYVPFYAKKLFDPKGSGFIPNN